MNAILNLSSVVSVTMRLLFAAGFIACACLTQAQTNIPLVPMGAVWKYLDTGVDQGTAWIAPAFNDSAWPSGPAQLGYGDGDEATTVSYGPEPNNKYITTYFRHTFVVNNPSAFTNAQMRILWNDGVVVYLNGMEVFRDYNMGTNAITFSTLALYPAEDYVFNPTVSPSLLVNGTNVLAVEVHLCATNSADLSFDLGMAANVRIPVPGLAGGPFVERQVLGFNVRLVARPPSGVTNYLVREKPPFGQPGTISHGGSYDPATGTILFGPFDEGQSRTLTYADSPPLGSWGRFGFTGEAVANGTSSAVVGDDYTEIPYFHSPPLEARLLLRWRPLSQQVALQRIGGGGAPWFLLASTNLQDWAYVGELGNVFDGFELVDAQAPNHPCRFYRAQTIPENPDPVTLAWIAPGTFTMGSPASEMDREPDEGPQTLVTLTRGFFMGRYEVTQGEYLAVMGSNPSYFKGDTNRPVEQVNWADATNYCAQFTAQERTAGRLPAGWVYRLPTEAEWEYACRAGTTTRFSYGDDPGYTQLRNYAWYAGYSGNMTHAVGGKLSNPWGLYDMSGNVWEWCLDWYADSLPGGSVSDPQGPVLDLARVVRGGSWGEGAGDCRSANRAGYDPTSKDDAIGFRVVLAPSQP